MARDLKTSVEKAQGILGLVTVLKAACLIKGDLETEMLVTRNPVLKETHRVPSLCVCVPFLN